MTSSVIENDKQNTQTVSDITFQQRSLLKWAQTSYFYTLSSIQQAQDRTVSILKKNQISANIQLHIWSVRNTLHLEASQFKGVTTVFETTIGHQEWDAIWSAIKVLTNAKTVEEQRL